MLAGAEDVPLGDHRQLEPWVQKAPGQGPGQDHRPVRRQLLRRRVQEGGVHVLLEQQLVQPLPPGHAAGQQRHPPALLPPLVQVPGQFPGIALVGGCAQPLELEQAAQAEVVDRPHKGVQGGHRKAVQLHQQLVVAQQQLCLGGQGVFPL